MLTWWDVFRIIPKDLRHQFPVKEKLRIVSGTRDVWAANLEFGCLYLALSTFLLILSICGYNSSNFVWLALIIIVFSGFIILESLPFLGGPHLPRRN